MVASQHRLKVNNLLRLRLSREQALEDVSELFRLLPGSGTRPLWTEPPPEKANEVTGDVHSYRKVALYNAFLKKFQGFNFGNPRETAKATFLSYEANCRASNQKIRHLRVSSHETQLQAVLLTAQRKISRVLGKFDLEELLSASRWGPGSTSSCKGALTAAATKFSSRPDVTPEFLARARLLMPLLPSWSALLADVDYGVIVNPVLSVIKGNKITFVPKTAKTHRTIAVEPHVNVFFQAGLGQMIRKRMRVSAKVDLDDQTLNQRLAHLGSLDDSLSTLDLEGASDTICVELVRDLLPEDWFEWLNAARSHYGELDGESIRFQKFSSMGNGATFDLESLIFWALSSAVVELCGYNPFWVNVFGDDIVVPSGCAAEVILTLEQVGFIVNKKKSFTHGPFRESCGKDYFHGFNVRPVYLKRIPVEVVDWLILANQIRSLAHEWGEREFCHADLKSAYDFCLSRIPKEIRAYKVPLGFDFRRNWLGGFEGNGLLSNFDEACPERDKNGWCGWTVSGIVVKTITVTENSRRLLVAGTHRTTQSGNELSMRDRYEFREESALTVPFSWYNLGPWFKKPPLGS